MMKGFTTAGICTNPDYVKVPDEIQRLLGGQVKAWKPKLSVDQNLMQVDCNFEVIVEEHSSKTFPNNQYPHLHHWYNGNTGTYLASYPKRKPVQPKDLANGLIGFCEDSEGLVKPDYIVSFRGGRSIGLICQLTGDNHVFLDSTLGRSGGGFSITNPDSPFYVNSEDRTALYLVLLEHYDQLKSTQLILWAVELVCSNGLTRRIKRNEISLAHLRTRDPSQIKLVLQEAAHEIEAYAQMKKKFIDTKLSLEDGQCYINDFFQDKEGGFNKATAIKKIYVTDLIGSHLSTRQNNYWRLLNAFTQYSSHHRIGTNEQQIETTARSLLYGGRARSNSNVITYLEDCLEQHIWNEQHPHTQKFSHVRL